MTRVLASLTNRIFLATAALVTLSVAIAVWLITAIVTTQAEQELDRGLEEAATLVDEYRTLSVTQLAQQARLIADLPKFKAVVELDHGPTVAPLAADYRAQIQSALFVVTNRQGHVLAAEGLDEGHTAAEAERWPAVAAALGGRESAFLLPTETRILQLVTVPIWIQPAAPEILGTLTVGVSLDRPFAARMKALTDSDVAFVAGGRVAAATLAPDAWPALAGVDPDRPPERLRLGDHDFVLRSRRLTATPVGAGPAVDAGAAAPVTLVLRSRSERLRFLRTLQTALVASALLVLLGATLVSYYVARSITRPLDAITASMREMATTGDLTRKVALPGGRWDDEDARLLATTLNAMTASIARFQREAAQRERLSSLGRLSTVLAHEIRNPLMIIKSALHTLRRAESSDDRRLAAIVDIDEETVRLNRLVNDVLDFARPIRFDMAPASLTHVCTEAASAAGGGETACRLDFAHGDDEIETDAERLRQALINLLQNARESLAAAPGVDTAITLRTSSPSSGSVRVVVADQGPGIAPEDLPRVFEPYFTTKRTGSGIGLAITRNIIEGLGGRIAISSAPGAGTEVVVDLPRAQAASAPTS